MDLIKALSQIVEKGNKRLEKILNRDYKDPIVEQIMVMSSKEDKYNISKDNWINQLYRGDNLIIMKKLLHEGYGEKFDLIYIDPPFLTNAKYKIRL